LSRKKYRSVLIDLINQIITIREDKELINSVADGIIKNSYFDKVCIVLIDKKKKDIPQTACIGFNISKAKLENLISKHGVISKLQM